MKINDFLEHHGVSGNPFSEEDAQTDLVFKTHCSTNTFHPCWDKLYGDPSEPTTAIAFGEKGSGKTALRLQMVRALTEFNADHPNRRPLVIEYADLNPFLDRFRSRQPRTRKIEKVLSHWQLWDHIDAMLSLSVTQLVDRILEPNDSNYPAAVDANPIPVKNLDRYHIRDLILLCGCYDQSRKEDGSVRAKRLAKKLHYNTLSVLWSNWKDVIFGIIASVVLIFLFYRFSGEEPSVYKTLTSFWLYPLLLATWIPRFWRLIYRYWVAWMICRSCRVLKHDTRALFSMFMMFPSPHLIGMPFPVKGSTENRYELLAKLGDILTSLKFHGIVILIDRIDEPYLVNGSPQLMWEVIRPLLDNKLLKYQDLGLKILLPEELLWIMERENEEFRQRARIDKQNMIRSLDWTGTSLYDLANARIEACALSGKTPNVSVFFESGIGEKRLKDAFSQLRVPRHLFKFMFRLLVKHANTHPDSDPVWQISVPTFEAEFAVYLREMEAGKR